MTTLLVSVQVDLLFRVGLLLKPKGQPHIDLINPERLHGLRDPELLVFRGTAFFPL